MSDSFALMIDAAVVGQKIELNVTGVGDGLFYRVRKINGEAARELYLEGPRGGRRVLFMGTGSRPWLRADTGRGSEHRRVTGMFLHNRELFPPEDDDRPSGSQPREPEPERPDITYRCKISGGRVIDLVLPHRLLRADVDRVAAFLITQVDD